MFSVHHGKNYCPSRFRKLPFGELNKRMWINGKASGKAEQVSLPSFSPNIHFVPQE